MSVKADEQIQASSFTSLVGIWGYDAAHVFAAECIDIEARI